MKNSKFFSFLHFITLLCGFNTLWYNSGWKGKLVRAHCTLSRLIAIVQIILINLYIKEVGKMEDWNELLFFVASTLTENMGLYKSFLFDSDTVKNMITEAFLYDDAVQRSNSRVKKGLEEHGNVCRKFLIFYTIIFLGILFSAYAGSVLLYVKSLNCDPYMEECTRRLPWTSVSILDLQTHYGASIIIHSIGLTFVGVFVLMSNITLASLCIFPTFKLKHLQHVLANFQYYGEILGESENISIREAEYFVIRECIIEHQKIISDFVKLREFTQSLFLIDFITHAIQTAPYLVIILAFDGTIDYVFSITVFCLAFLIFELLMIYWFAQMIVDESINVGTSISLSNWYETDVKTLKLMQLLMIRSNRRLALRVGPFYDMDLGIFLKICKGVYTVVTIFKRNL